LKRNRGAATSSLNRSWEDAWEDLLGDKNSVVRRLDKREYARMQKLDGQP
jgi:hypothetical protein